MPSPLVGPSYELLSRPASVQRTINMMPVPLEPGNERTDWVLKDVPGLKKFDFVPPPVFVGALLWLNDAGSSNFVDQARPGLPWTIFTGSIAQMFQTASSARWGAAGLKGVDNSSPSIRIDGLSIPHNFANGFCMEYWFRVDTAGALWQFQTTLFYPIGSGSINLIARSSGGNMIIEVTSGGSVVSWATSTSSPLPTTVGVWYHICMTFDGTSLRLFRNGVQLVLTTPPVFNITLGRFSAQSICSGGGSISADDIRMTLNSRRYDSPFTPPGAQFINDFI